jgi:hypothetical protein
LLSSLLSAVGPSSKRGRGHVNECGHNHQDNINYASHDSVVRTIDDDFSANSLSCKDTVCSPPPTACSPLAATATASPNNSVVHAVDDNFPVTALSREYTDGPTPLTKDEDGGNGTKSRRGGEDMNLGGGVQCSGHGCATTLTSRAKCTAGAAAILQQPQLLALELDGKRAALADLGRERDTLAVDVILWQGRAVATKAERDLLLLGGMGGRSTSCPQPNQRSTSNTFRDMTQRALSA